MSPAVVDDPSGVAIPRRKQPASQTMSTVGTGTDMVRVNQLFDGACALSVMLVAFASLNIGRMPNGLQEFLAVRMTVRHFTFGVLLIVIWHCCFAVCGLYRANLRESVVTHSLRIALTCTFASSLILSFVLASNIGAFRLHVVVYFWLVATAAEIVGRRAIAALGPHVRMRTDGIKHVVIVGSGAQALNLFHAIQTSRYRSSHVGGFVDTISDGRIIPAEIQSRLIGSLDDLEMLLSTRAVDQVLIALPVKSFYVAIQQAIDVCERVGVEVKYSADIFSPSLARRAYDHAGEMPAVRLHVVVDDSRLLVKRGIDLVGAICGLTLLSPILALCAVAVKWSSPGPILFCQVRHGFKRQLFRMYKFRTMVQDAEQLQSTLESQNEALGPIFKIHADPRVTRVGRIMRKLSLDELPQLFNVLVGDMSLVGPRPMSLRDVSRFSESWLLRRFSVKPGLTCLWQVNGRSNTNFDQWVALDLEYIDNWSLSLDVRILVKTVPAVFWGIGAV